MVAVQNAIRAAGLRRTAVDVASVLERYLLHPDRIACSVAEEAAGRILGFQSLRRMTAGNPHGVAEGWGFIGTHVSPSAARQGVGSALFRATLAAARHAGVENIDASIGADNALGLAYYHAMGFRTYRSGDGLICKVYRVSSDS